MKILYALETVNLAAGFDRVIIEKVNYLAEHGYDVVLTVTSHILSKPYFPISDKVKLIDMGVDFHKQYKHGLILRAVVYLSLMRNYRKAMSALLFSEKPDIVITSLGREMDFLTDIKDGSVKIGESHIAKDFARNLHLMEKKGFLYKMIARYWRNKLDRGVRKLDALVLLTQHDADSWAGLTKTHVIPNSIPFYPPQTSTCENKKVIFVGRLNEQKGLEYLIESWKGVCARFKDWELHIYGGGNRKNCCTNL